MTTARIVRRLRDSKSGHLRGFTLVDTVIVVMIIGILAAVATPKFVDAIMFHRAEAAARRVKADLEWSRRHAISASAPVTVSFDSAAESYAIPALQDLDRSGQSYQVDLTAYPHSSNIVSAACGGDEDIVISRYGDPDTAATITVQAGKYTQTVTVDADSGKVTIP